MLAVCRLERVKDRFGLFHQLGGVGITLEQRCGLCPLRKQGFLQDSEGVWGEVNPFRDDIQCQPILGGCPIQHSIMLCGGMNSPISQMGPLRLRKWYIIVPGHVPSRICTCICGLSSTLGMWDGGMSGSRG